MTKIKILFTTPILEYPAAGGPQLRIENSIKALNKITELHIICREMKIRIGGKRGESHFKRLCYTFCYSPSSSLRSKVIQKIIKTISRIGGLLFFAGARDFINWIEKQPVRADANYIVKYAKKQQIDVIWFGYGNISYNLIKAIRAKAPTLRIVCDTDSVWSRFIMREAPYENDLQRREKILKEGAAKEQEERELVEMCDVTTAVSEVDADYYRSITNNPDKIKVFSNVIDLENYKNAPPPPNNFRKPCFYLAGTFGHYHSPMDTAARWVINEVLPIVKKAIPEVHFYIIGREAEISLSYVKDLSVTVIGKVPSVLPYLCNADVSIVPLKFESGTRFKILEAGSCGTPVVSTTLGAEGILVQQKENILIADTPEDFAAAIVLLINNRELAKSIATNCYEMVKYNYSLLRAENEATQIVDYLKGQFL